MMSILVTGTAGFIGYHVAKRLIARGDEVVGLDNINYYYDVRLKYGRLAETGIAGDAIEYNQLVCSDLYPNYSFIKLNLEDKTNICQLFSEHKFGTVCNLAAQAGVRHSLTNPDAYVTSNIVGFLNIIEACRHHDVEHLVNEPMVKSSFKRLYHHMGVYDIILNLLHTAITNKKSVEFVHHTLFIFS